ncbi:MULTISPECIES: hypothetical protein [Anaerotruncus]|jgi:hypothetical protein|uniref:hypothetical protein n=1 Tax=Anaerotruncus TaxID=244127 RepID=UPI0008336E4D|nr:MULTISPECIES: hypothetical protein [Anaerotruncus]RGX55145.1 hypothetical protein DWV16_10275 [Anaerotruncus sp. AF02-27]
MSIDIKALSFTAWDLQEHEFTLPAPLEWEIVKSFDSPAHSLEAVFWQDRGYPELYRLRVALGEVVLFSGGIDEQTATENDEGARMKLIARSAGAVLLDNEAQPQLYQNVTLQDLFQNHIRPYGFTRLSSDENPILNVYQVVKGTSEWEAFTNFYRNVAYGFTWLDDSGLVRCAAAAPTGQRHIFSNAAAGALRYANLKITNNRYSPVTEYVIKDLDGFYSYSYQNPKASAMKLTRKRYLNPLPDFFLYEGQGTFEAIIRTNRSMLGKRVITLTSPDLLEIAVTDLVDLSGNLFSFGGLFVQQVRWKLDSSGAFTTLTLLDYDYL